MLFNNIRRSPTLVDICDFNALRLRDHNADINTRNYLLSKTSLPVSYQELRSVVTNRVPSNIVILSKRSYSPTSSNTSKSQQQKTEFRKGQKQLGFDVYRSLVRSISHCSIASERDISKDEGNLLVNPFTIDRVPLLPSTGFFYPHNLSKIAKHDTSSNHKRTSCSKKQINNESLRSSRYQPIESMQQISLEIFDRTTITPTPTPTNRYYDETNDRTSTTMATIKNVLPCSPKARSRKQLHVYIPQVYS